MNIFINDNMFKCKVCVTPNSITDGMKNKTFNMNFNGMFFIMKEGILPIWECAHNINGGCVSWKVYRKNCINFGLIV